jgi:hypothetical protein
MKNTLRSGLAAALAAAMFATTFVPVQATAMPLPKVGVSQSSDAEPVQYRRERRGWHNGHRGYRYNRHGYRRHSDGWWYPLAAFGAGAIIGGAIANEPPVRYRPRGNAHIDWCYNRYRSYRASDNTFQPYNGPRRQCRSPYG